MGNSILVCKNESRRKRVREKKHLNGLDYLEISDNQLTLSVYFLNKLQLNLVKENFRIEGGRRITDIQVTSIEIHREEDPGTDDCVHVTVDRYGDFSSYRLCLIEVDPRTQKPIVDIDKDGKKRFRPKAGFDPRYVCLEFSFKANCPSDLDCKPQSVCLPEQYIEPEINYLAKDYASFRQLIIDRLALTLPDWKERHAPDLGIALVELLAYVGDHLSYYQDAVATEAYLDTARRRISVRRHARLVDYYLHEGCNARTWVTFTVSSDSPPIKPDDFYLITDPGLSIAGNVIDHIALPNTLPKPYLIFEPLVENRDKCLVFFRSHNEIKLYTWGDLQCCLAKGAIAATLLDPGKATPKKQKPGDNEPCKSHEEGDYPEEPSVIPPQDSDYQLRLKPCDIIIFEEIKGPKTGQQPDADPTHRHAVRLTKVLRSQDPLTGQLIWEVEWALEDALPFALCLSAIKQDDCSPICDVSVARGNVLLVDHGETVKDKDEYIVPLAAISAECGDGCTPRESTKIAGHFNPELLKTDITYSEPLLPCGGADKSCSPSPRLRPANLLLKQNPRAALPTVKLYETRFFENNSDEETHAIWEPRLDLLNSDPEDRHFIVEVEDDRRAKLRFGNGESGRLPDAEARFQVEYRIGNGVIGNVGAESITHMVFHKNLPNGICFVLKNPFPATGGTNPEPVAEAKLFAPHKFRKELQRAITADDYAKIVMRDFSDKVQRAAAKLLWTGSWYEVLVAIDPFGSVDEDEKLLYEIKQHLFRYRRISHDVVVVQASYVALDIAMTVCVLPHYLRGHVKVALLNVFSNGIMPDGAKGFFHPDNLSFGEGIYLSKLVAAAQAVEGVESVVITKLQPFFAGPNQEIQNGILSLGPFEVARLDNDPSFPENGKLTLDMRGGR
jgi:hypothetical protein